MRVFPSEQPLLPAILKGAGSNYSTLMVGKWHLGFARPMDTPEGRGFDAFLGFFEGGEDYYDHTLGGTCGRDDVHDLWYANAGERSRPAVQPARSGTYSTNLYTEFVVDRIVAHAAKEGNGRFCEVLNATEVPGLGVFLAPWMPDPHAAHLV